MREYNLPEPEFLDERGCFIVKLYKYKENEDNKMIESSEEKNLIIFFHHQDLPVRNLFPHGI